MIEITMIGGKFWHDREISQHHRDLKSICRNHQYKYGLNLMVGSPSGHGNSSLDPETTK